jgi:hypothetical protein
MPIIPPNNTTGLYGIDTTVSIGNTLFATNLNISNNAVVGNNITAGNTITAGNNIVAGGEVQATGNITTAGFFVGNFAGNIVGNVTVPGANTQVLYNNAGNIGTATGFTFTNTTGRLDVPGSITAVGNIQGNYFIGNGSQLTGVATTLPSATANQYLRYSGTAWAAADLDIANDLSPNLGGNLNAGNFEIFNAGNIQTNGIYTGNGGFISNISGSNVNGPVAVATTASTVSGNAQANITSVGTLTSLSVSGNITSSGNVSGNFILGNGSQLTGLASTYGNANVVTLLAGFGSNTVSTTGNITGGFFLGDGSLLTNLPAGNYSNANVSAFMAAFGSNTITTTGNITGGNLVASANLTSTQQTVVGTANVGTTGNIVVSGRNIATDMAFNPDGGNAATHALSRVTVGTGWNGNITHRNQGHRLMASDSYNLGNTGVQVRLAASEPFVTLTANVTNTNTRNQAIGGYLRIGGGSAANTIFTGTSAAGAFSVASGQFNLDIGNISPYNLGNTTVGSAALNGGAAAIAAGSTVNNLYGVLTNLASPIGAPSSGNLVNYMGYASNLNLSQVPTGNIFGFYHGSNATGSVTGAGVNNTIRQSPGYYAFYNADDLAQIQLGSLRRYHEFESATATSGSFAIDKNTAQVHNIVPTGNCTITGYSNMIVSVNDGATNDAQVDTLTIIVEQGATPYTITLPTGSTFKYAGNIRTVGNTANSITMISVTAANVSGTTTYLTTVSPEFV